MRKLNMKANRTMIIASFLVVCIICVGAIYVVTNQKNTKDDILIEENISTDPIVEVVKVPKADDEKIEVPEIKEEVIIKDIDNKVEEEIIDEPLPIQPEKPKNTPPKKKPQTKGDVENMTKEPEYNEEEITYIPEAIEEPKITNEFDNNYSEESNLVPDSENPFLQDNIPNNGDGGEMLGKDYYENGVVAGQGDKF